MSHLYLPPLKNDHSVPMPDESGVWMPSNDRSLLSSLSDGLEMSADGVGRGVSSIPDVWARPRLFQDALFNQAHPLHSRVSEEWRGLLSLLALRKIHAYPVSFKVVDLRDFIRDDEEDDKEKAGIPTPRIVKALYRMKPRPVNLETKKEYDWVRVTLIYFGDLPVGAFSPTTLVYTGGDYHRTLKNKDLVLQQTDGKSKSGYLGLPELLDERKYVGVWVKGLLERLKPLLNTREDHPDHMITLKLNSLLLKWRDSLPTGTVTAVTVPDQPTKVEGLPEEFFVYRALLHPLVEPEARDLDTLSEVYLTENYMRDTSHRVVVVNKELLEKNKRVWKLKTLRQLGGDSEHALKEYFDGASGEVIDEEKIHEAANAIWIRPERFFLTNKLIKAGKGQAFLAEGEERLNGGGVRYVLPFRREILHYFTPERIKEGLKPRFEPVSGGVKFIFDLYVGNEKTGTEKIQIEKTYLEEEGEGGGTIEEVEVPVLDIFPDYAGDNWRKYYLLQSSSAGLIVSPIFGGQGCTATKREHITTLDEKRHTVVITELTGGESFPEGLEIREQGIPGESDPVGVVLLAKEERKGAGLRGQWIVGIDFGTSNTNVFRFEDGNDTIRWNLSLDEKLRPITASDPVVRKEILESYFFPDRSLEFPIPTGLRILNPGETQKKILLDTNIYIPDGRSTMADNVRTNIKWDDAWLSQHYFEILLYLLLLDATAKEINEIEFRFAYPKVKTGGEQEMRRYWQNALDNITQKPERALDVWVAGADNKGRPIVNKIAGGFSEGRAAGEYFGSPQAVGATSYAKLGNAAICLDVGGATTDLSIWVGYDIIGDESVLLAGANISNYLRSRRLLAEYLFSPAAARTLYSVRESSVKFAAALNLILRNPEEERQVHENLLFKKSEPDIQKLRQILVLEFGAIVYYSGLVMGAVAKKRPEVLEIVSQNGLSFHWGGNAAKLLSWLDFGEVTPDSTGSQLLNRIFGATPVHESLKENYPLGQHQSPGHKSEVAGGLVIIRREDGSSPRMSNSFVSGETIQLKGGREISYDAFIGEGDLFSSESEVLFDGTSLDRLKDFVDVVNRVAIDIGLLEERQKIDLTAHQQAAVGGSIRNLLVRSASEESADRKIEPIFIMEVKELIGLLSEG